MAVLHRHAPIFLSGTNAERLTFSTTLLAIGTLFYETDTTRLYRWIGGAWTELTAATMSLTVSSKLINFNADDTAVVYLCDATGGAITMSLPTAASYTNRIYIVKKIDASVNTVIIDADGGDLIDGGGTATLLVQYESLSIVCDGSDWYVF